MGSERRGKEGDVQLRWHLGPMEEEEVHNPPAMAATKHPFLSPDIFLWERPA